MGIFMKQMQCPKCEGYIKGGSCRKCGYKPTLSEKRKSNGSRAKPAFWVLLAGCVLLWAFVIGGSGSKDASTTSSQNVGTNLPVENNASAETTPAPTPAPTPIPVPVSVILNVEEYALASQEQITEALGKPASKEDWNFTSGYQKIPTTTYTYENEDGSYYEFLFADNQAYRFNYFKDDSPYNTSTDIIKMFGIETTKGLANSGAALRQENLTSNIIDFWVPLIDMDSKSFSEVKITYPHKRLVNSTDLEIGDTMVIEMWEVKVTELKMAKSIKGDYGSFSPGDGNLFAVVSAEITNNGTSAGTFLPMYPLYTNEISCKLVYDGAYDFPSTTLIAHSKDLKNAQLNPLTTKKGILAFEVPEEVAESGEPLNLVFEFGETAGYKLR